jgi:hypothetical protein
MNEEKPSPDEQREFREWLQTPVIRADLVPEGRVGLSPETIRRIERELHLL